MKVTELEWGSHTISGKCAIVEFENGFAASVVTGPLFYSNSASPYEIAVMKDGAIRYDTCITSDVCGYLTEEEANNILERIAAL